MSTCRSGMAGRRMAQGSLCLIFPSRWHSVSAFTCSGPLFHHYLPLLTRASVPVTSDYAYLTRLALNLGHFICGGPHNKMSLSAFQFQIFIEKPHWPTSSKHFDAGHTSLGSDKVCFALDCPWERCLPLVPPWGGTEPGWTHRVCGVGQIPWEGGWVAQAF